MLCMTKQPRERNEREPRRGAATRGGNSCFGSTALSGKRDPKRQKGNGAGAELESLARWRERRECLVGWMKLRELRLRQREGTRGHCRARRRSALALNFLFPAACFGECPGDASPWDFACWEEATELPRPCSRCRVTAAHRHAVTPQLYVLDTRHCQVLLGHSAGICRVYSCRDPRWPPGATQHI